MKKQVFFSLALLTVAAADLYAPAQRTFAKPASTTSVVKKEQQQVTGAVTTVAGLKAKYSSSQDLASIALAAEHVANGLAEGGDQSSSAYKDAMNVLS